ncbi:YceD family protein [Facklamia hominis]|uniref:YceD family protein n=1 Tax=Facklamia hominis TaxID=178214 RepID=UPI00288AE9F2|nr:DUF177 domain-containing protein [Facklamia hominis]WPJ91224.1 DUF177 domain-containing protein [Facklamia hominis]
MKWTIRQIHDQSREGILSFEETLDIQAAIKERKSEIIAISPVQAKGYFVDRQEDIFLHCQLKAKVTLPSTRSLKPVQVPLEIEVKERYVQPGMDETLLDYEETTLTLDNDYIDLITSAVDNILLNLPYKVLASDEEGQELPKGNNWDVLTEEEYQNRQEEIETVDPRFSALKTLLNKDDVESSQ